jgi:hypothetical protein
MARRRAKRRDRVGEAAGTGRERRWRGTRPLLLLIALVAAGSTAVAVLSSGAAPRKAREQSLASGELRDTARQLLETRARPSERAERARAIRRDLAALRSELSALAANPDARSGPQIEEIRERIARGYLGESDDQEPFFARHGDGPGAQMIGLVNDLETLARDPQGGRADVARLIAEIDRALAVPPAEPRTVRTMTPLSEDAR